MADAASMEGKCVDFDNKYNVVKILGFGSYALAGSLR